LESRHETDYWDLRPRGRPRAPGSSPQAINMVLGSQKLIDSHYTVIFLLLNSNQCKNVRVLLIFLNC